jgi:hypothetical protein
LASNIFSFELVSFSTAPSLLQLPTEAEEDEEGEGGAEDEAWMRHDLTALSNSPMPLALYALLPSITSSLKYASKDPTNVDDDDDEEVDGGVVATMSSARSAKGSFHDLWNEGGCCTPDSSEVEVVEVEIERIWFKRLP